MRADQVCNKVEKFRCCFVFIDCFTACKGLLYFCKYKHECHKLPWIWIVLYFKYSAVSRYNTCYGVWYKWRYIRTLLLLLLLYFDACKSASILALFTHVSNSNKTSIILCLLSWCFVLVSWSPGKKASFTIWLLWWTILREPLCLISCCSFISCLDIRFSYEAVNCT